MVTKQLILAKDCDGMLFVAHVRSMKDEKITCSVSTTASVHTKQAASAVTSLPPSAKSINEYSSTRVINYLDNTALANSKIPIFKLFVADWKYIYKNGPNPNFLNI